MATFQRSLVSLSLVLLGFGIIVFSLLLIGCSFDINYDSDFQDSDFQDDDIETEVHSQFNYYQYWAGIPFLATGVLVLLSAIFQRSKPLAVITLVLCVVSMGLTLLVLNMSSGTSYTWQFMERKKRYLESKGYSCSKAKNCICTKGEMLSRVSWLDELSCEKISKLSGLYTALTVSSIIIAVFCVFNVIIMTKFSWKQNRYIRYTQDEDDYSQNNVAAAPTYAELSVANT